MTHDGGPGLVGTVLVARTDNVGDVLLAGPAVRAVAARAERVVLLAGPRGRAAAELLPGVDRIIEWCAPWIDPEPGPVRPDDVEWLLRAVRAESPSAALVLTSYHQSPLPLALLLRLAGVPWIGATSEDYPGALLDLRHRASTGTPEPERMLSLAAAAGFSLPPDDHGGLAITHPLPDPHALAGRPGYVVVHPGASAPTRAIPPVLAARTVAGLRAEGARVVVTGAPGERTPGTGTTGIARSGANDLGGRTDLPELAGVLRDASVVVAGNTGPAHLAAAVGTPVVSVFAPVVSATAWAPYGTRVRLLGDQDAPCRGTRARRCPVAGHPCVGSLSADDVISAVHDLAGEEP